jgi:hypothetical protein
VARERVGNFWAGLTRRKEFFKELEAFRLRLRNLASSPSGNQVLPVKTGENGQEITHA